MRLQTGTLTKVPERNFFCTKFFALRCSCGELQVFVNQFMINERVRYVQLISVKFQILHTYMYVYILLSVKACMVYTDSLPSVIVAW